MTTNKKIRAKSLFVFFFSYTILMQDEKRKKDK